MCSPTPLLPDQKGCGIGSAVSNDPHDGPLRSMIPLTGQFKSLLKTDKSVSVRITRFGGAGFWGPLQQRFTEEIGKDAVVVIRPDPIGPPGAMRMVRGRSMLFKKWALQHWAARIVTHMLGGSVSSSSSFSSSPESSSPHRRTTV